MIEILERKDIIILLFMAILIFFMYIMNENSFDRKTYKDALKAHKKHLTLVKEKKEIYDNYFRIQKDIASPPKKYYAKKILLIVTEAFTLTALAFRCVDFIMTM